jgi:integrase
MPRTARLTVKRKKNGKWYIEGYWIPDASAPNGRRRYRPEFPSRQAAEAEIVKIKKRRAEEGYAAERLTENDRLDAIRAKELLKNHAVSLEDAARHYAQHLVATSRSIKVGPLCEQFLALKHREMESNVEGKWTPEDYRDTKSRCLRFAARFGDRWAVEVTADEIHDWLEELKFECGAQNRKNIRKALSRLFTYAKHKRYCPHNPINDVKGIKVPKKRPAIFSADQITQLLNAAPDDLVAYIALGAFAGLRPSEAQKFLWEEVRDDGQLKVREGEEGQVRFVSISTNLAAWLSLVKQSAGPAAPPEADRKTSELAQKLNLLTDWPQDIIRHSYGTAHACRYENVDKTSFQMGNSPPTVKAKYLAAIPLADAIKWWNVFPTPSRIPVASVAASYEPEKTNPIISSSRNAAT